MVEYVSLIVLATEGTLMNAFLVGIAISGLVASLRVAARLVFIICFREW